MSSKVSQDYRGNRITVAKGKQWGYLVLSINGHPIANPIGWMNKPDDVDRQLTSARGTIDNFNERPHAYTNGNGEVSYQMRLDPS